MRIRKTNHESVPCWGVRYHSGEPRQRGTYSWLVVTCLTAILNFVAQGQAQIPSTLGWYQIPNTTMPACPSGFSNCLNVINAWSGGIADTQRNRLIYWGGGHVDYGGNEVYALDLNTLTNIRLNNPSTPAGSCVAADPDGNPNARHTYDGLAYIANQDRMFAFAGSLYCGAGTSASDTWTFNFSNLTWQTEDPHNGSTPPGNGTSSTNLGDVSDYDPVTGLVYVGDLISLFTYDYPTNTYTRISRFSWGDYHQTGVIDPGRRLFLVFGNGNNASINLTGTGFKTLNATNCGSMASTGYPGLAYDSVQKIIVGWAGGNTVYLYNPDTDSCTSVTYPNGPGAQQASGTFGRFRYFPTLNVFAVVNAANQNAYALRLTNGTPPPPDTTPPTVAVTAPMNGSTISGTATVTGTAADNVAVSNVQVSIDGGAFAPASGTTNWTFSLNTTTLSNGSHTLAAKATDSSGNTATATNVTVTVSNTVSTSTSAAEVDFQARCHTPGVVYCQSFDDPSGFQQNVNIYQNSTYPGVFPVMDTTTARSGSSLRIDVPPFQGANAGKFDTAFPGIGGNNTDFYFQVASMASPEMFSNLKNSATTGWPTWKNHSFFNGNTSCTGLELVNAISYSGNIPTGTFNCSDSGFYTDLSGNPDPLMNPPYLFQQGDYNCQYRSENPTSCFFWVNYANKWITFYYHVHMGIYNSSTDTYDGSVIEAWVTWDGQPYKKWISVSNFPLSGNGSAGIGGKINHLELYPYMTGKSASIGGYPTAHVWYDELIVSAQPITAPAVPPAANGGGPTGTTTTSTTSTTTTTTNTTTTSTTSSTTTTTLPPSSPATTPSLKGLNVYPNPAVKQDPTIRVFMGQVSSIEVTIFNVSGRVVHSTTLSGTPTGISNGQYYYDYPWIGSKASGIYFAVIHGKASDGTIIRARTRFAVIM